MGHQPWINSLSGRSIGVVLGLEGKCDREEHGEREDVPGETVGIPFTHVSQNRTGDLGPNSYNDDISLEDAIHTALLTLKEGFEGQMTEKTIEIGVVTVPTDEDLEGWSISSANSRPKPTFRKLTEEEVRDYLAL